MTLSIPTLRSLDFVCANFICCDTLLSDLSAVDNIFFCFLTFTPIESHMSANNGSEHEKRMVVHEKNMLRQHELIP